MCLGGGGSKPKEDPVVKQEQESQKAEEVQQKKVRKQEALSDTLTTMRGGRGRRSLIKSGSGGMGYYNEYL